MDELQIKTCPTCGGKRIHRVERDVTRKYKGQPYIVPALAFYDCPDCGEKVYDREAMMKIEAFSPAYRRLRVSSKAGNHAAVSGATQNRQPTNEGDLHAPGR